MTNTHNTDSTMAFNAQQSKKNKPKIVSKGSHEQNRNAKNAVCIYPGRQFSLHTNGNCNAQNSKPAPSKNKSSDTIKQSRPIGQSFLSDSDKVKLFDKAAAKASSDSATANAAIAMAAVSIQDSDDEEVVELTTAYSLIVNDPSSESTEMYMDSGTNRDIFNSQDKFKELHPIQPV